MTYRFKQCVISVAFKYFIEQCTNCLNEVFGAATESNFQLRNSFQKLKCPFRKTNNGQYALSYIGPTFWNKTADTLKRSNNFNNFKHNFKKDILKELKNSNLLKLQASSSSSIYFNFEHKEGPQCKYKLYRHVLCYLANNKSDFFSTELTFNQNWIFFNQKWLLANLLIVF